MSGASYCQATSIPASSSGPTSFFVLDERIPKGHSRAITEAEGSRKKELPHGASACARKAIYEFLVRENAEGEHYEDKIKSLKAIPVGSMPTVRCPRAHPGHD